ncbi:hypothetical protein [Caproiciproducens galactitolivorans]|uniref:Uncharacterized protein n=1 Tax=Caproiciproducens galactitolivorans TaxID=642589 RepID=A0ABT4BRJ9_9FIRM|nr:hypothetical protein [Caproiciproducens galactitolivorans]MCY1713415.1 hypothetical protein [Caproiciproducens galactitolivorans]
MNVRLEFKNTSYLDVQNVSVILLIQGSEQIKPMQKSEDGWYTQLLLEPGDSMYKFLINNEIRLNDPSANVYMPDDSEELWSVIVIDDLGFRLYNNEQYEVNVEDYSVTNIVTEIPDVVNRKSFNLTMDKSVVTRFEFNHITGIHAITAVWFNPRGEVHESTENLLYADEKDPESSVFMWFWMQLNEADREYPEGIWTMKLFVDGSYVLEDQYTIVKRFAYTSAGRF